MTQMLTVPAEVVVQLRGALLERLGRPATEITYAGVLSDRFKHLERITDPLQRFDRHRALLDAEIGWRRTVRRYPDLSAHRWALLACLSGCSQSSVTSRKLPRPARGHRSVLASGE